MPEREEHQREAGCTDVTELLPVYLNRSLEAKAARRVEAHLATCAACRQEERDTRTVWDLCEGHLPVELLLDYALAEPMSSQRLAMVESHLGVCPRCSEEVATVRQEGMSDRRASEPAFRKPPPAVASGRGLRILAWAACLAAVVASVGWIRTWRQLVDERALSSAPVARANLSVVDLLPVSQPLLRQGGTDPRVTANQVELPDDAEEIVLVLLSGGRSCESGCLLEVFEVGTAQPKWRLEGLVATPDGHLTLALPSDWLLPDRCVLAVQDQALGEIVAEYLVELRHSATEARQPAVDQVVR